MGVRFGICQKCASGAIMTHRAEKSDIAVPPLQSMEVLVGGVLVTYAEAARAVTVLTASPVPMVGAFLKRQDSPLAGLDYRAVAAPSVGRFRERIEPTNRRGAGGRPVVKAALVTAICQQMLATALLHQALGREAMVAAAKAAFAANWGYAEAMAEAARSIAGSALREVS